jgi:hypothetical protein
VSRPYYKAGDRVEYREMYANHTDILCGARGTVLEGAPMGLMTGVSIRWDNGDEQVMSCLQARKLSLLERLAEI